MQEWQVWPLEDAEQLGEEVDRQILELERSGHGVEWMEWGIKPANKYQLCFTSNS